MKNVLRQQIAKGELAGCTLNSLGGLACALTAENFICENHGSNLSKHNNFTFSELELELLDPGESKKFDSE